MSSAWKPIGTRDKKRYLSLIIDVVTETMAANIIFKKIIKTGEVKEVAHYMHKAI